MQGKRSRGALGGRGLLSGSGRKQLPSADRVPVAFSICTLISIIMVSPGGRCHYFLYHLADEEPEAR